TVIRINDFIVVPAHYGGIPQSGVSVVGSIDGREVRLARGTIRSCVVRPHGTGDAAHGRSGESGRKLIGFAVAHADVVGEEEELVLEDGTANRQAKLILGIFRLDVAIVLVRPGIGIKPTTLIKLKGAAVEIIGSALGDHRYLAAVYVAEFSIGIPSDDVELLNRERRRIVAYGVLQGFVDIDAVENVAVRLLAIAIEGRLSIGGCARMRCIGITLCALNSTHCTGIRVDGSGYEQGGELNIQPIHGHVC